MRRWLLAILLVGAFLVGSFFYFAGSLVFLLSGEMRAGEVAVVEILGAIFDAKPVVEQLNSLKKDSAVKAVVIRIDSPGGSVGASQEIFESIRDFAESKPVVASLGTVAASGGYYVASAAKKIVANAGTITGSIGVRMEWINVEDLLRWARVRPVTLKSGRLKDIGSPTRPMSDEEKTFLEGILTKLHAQFKKAVAESRGLTGQQIEEIGDGRILTGAEALEKKLVDELGGLKRAVRIAGELAGVKGEPEFFFSKDPSRNIWEYLPNSLADSLTEGLINRLSEAGLGVWLAPIRFSF